MWLTLRFFQTERFLRPWPFRPSCSTLRGPQQETNTWVHRVVLVLRLWSPFSKNFFIFPFSEWIPPQKNTHVAFFLRLMFQTTTFSWNPLPLLRLCSWLPMGRKMKSWTVFLTGYMRVCIAFFEIFIFVTLFPFSSCLLVSKQFFKTTRKHNNDRLSFFQTIPEEVFASNGAIWWSTTGKFLAYVEFNDTEVQHVEFTWYGAEQYPHTVAVPYPKVGSACSLPLF